MSFTHIKWHHKCWHFTSGSAKVLDIPILTVLNPSCFFVGGIRNRPNKTNKQNTSLPIHQGFPGGSEVKHLPAMWEIWVPSLGGEDPLEKEIATHSSILAWRIPWMEEPCGLQSTGSQRVGRHWATSLSLSYLMGLAILKCVDSTIDTRVNYIISWLSAISYYQPNIYRHFVQLRQLHLFWGVRFLHN